MLPDDWNKCVESLRDVAEWLGIEIRGDQFIVYNKILQREKAGIFKRAKEAP